MLTEPSSARVPHPPPMSRSPFCGSCVASWQEPLSAGSVLLSSRDSDIVGCSGLAVGAGCPAGPVRHARSTPTVPDPPARHCRAPGRDRDAPVRGGGHGGGRAYIGIHRWPMAGAAASPPRCFLFITLERVPVFATSREVATSRDGTHSIGSTACGQLR